MKYPKNGTKEEILRYVVATWWDVWTTRAAEELFEFEAFGGGLAIVTRKSDGVRGSLNFHHIPRFYFDFLEA